MATPKKARPKSTDILVRGVSPAAHEGLKQIADANGMSVSNLTTSALNLLGLSGGVVVASAGPTTSRFVDPGEAVNAARLAGVTPGAETNAEIAQRLGINSTRDADRTAGLVISLPEWIHAAAEVRRRDGRRRAAALMAAAAPKNEEERTARRVKRFRARVHPEQAHIENLRDRVHPKSSAPRSSPSSGAAGGSSSPPVAPRLQRGRKRRG